ncbi:MAG: metal-dependent hydrolase [Acidimicrobiia bacterium]|nr:metal-dependent hydrolase [Acidimicrobiia bacterium]
MLLWHVGGTIALVRYTFRDERMDLRFLILGAVLPDLIDTPLGLALYSGTQSVRLVGHSLLVAGGLMVAVLLTTRRGRPRKRWMPLAIGVLLHLFLDAMWADPETLWWPFLGWSFSAAPEVTVADYVSRVLADWRMWALEAVGAVYLGVLARRARFGDPAARELFRTTGRVGVPIGTDQ